MRTKLTRAAAVTATLAGRSVKSLPGLAATGCAVTGAAVLWGAGWAFLAAVPFLLLLAREIN